MQTITASLKEKLILSLQNKHIKFRHYKHKGWLQVPVEIIYELEKHYGFHVTGDSFRDQYYFYLDDRRDCMPFLRCFPSINFFKYIHSGDLTINEDAKDIETLTPYKTV